MKDREKHIRNFARLAKMEYDVEDDLVALKIGEAIVEILEDLVEEIKKS